MTSRQRDDDGVFDDDDDDDSDDDDIESDDEEVIPKKKPSAAAPAAVVAAAAPAAAAAAAAPPLEKQDDDDAKVKKKKKRKKEDGDGAVAPPKKQKKEKKKKKKKKKKSGDNNKKASSSNNNKWLDDAAQESGEDNDDDDEDDDDDDSDNNEYIKDGFVVDEEEEDDDEMVVKKKKKGDLEDSDDDDDDEDDSDDDDDDSEDDSDDDGKKKASSSSKKKKPRRKLKKVRKMRPLDRLDDEDLALIQEAARAGGGEPVLPTAAAVAAAAAAAAAAAEDEQRRRKALVHVKARDEAELRKGLFYDSDEQEETEKKEGGGGGAATALKPKPPNAAAGGAAAKRSAAADRYDEDGWDDFIEDDIGDQQNIFAADHDDMPLHGGGAYGGINQVSEAQLQEASEIFGTDYLEFMGGVGGADKKDGDKYDDDDDYEEEALLGRNKFKERGVGITYDSEDEIISDDDDEDDSDDDDMFEEDEDDENKKKDGAMTTDAQQRAEALKLKRERRKLARDERRRKALAAKTAKRKAQLRRAFEPVQLVENFCTDRDDEIRQTDAPERFFDWKTPFHGGEDNDDDIDDDGDDDDAAAATTTKTPATPAEAGAPMNKVEDKQARWIVSRIPDITVEYQVAKSSMMTDGNIDYDDDDDDDELLAPPDADPNSPTNMILSSIANALRLMHCDMLEPDFIRRYRKDYVTSPAVRKHLYTIMDEDNEWDRILSGRRKVGKLLSLVTTAANIDSTGTADGGTAGIGVVDRIQQLTEELQVAQVELNDKQSKLQDVQAELDALVAKEDDDDDDELFEDDDDDDELKAAEKKKEKTRLSSHVKDLQDLFNIKKDKVTQLESQLDIAKAQNQAFSEKGPVQRVITKTCRDLLWDALDYKGYLKRTASADGKVILDMNGYLSLIKEGNDSIRKKEIPVLDAADALAVSSKSDKRKRSRRFDRDFYRTCVSEGLRAVCYKFLLAPNRVGIKLEDHLRTGGFDFSKIMPGEAAKKAPGGGAGDPLKWVAPVISQSTPTDFANELIGSGDLVLLSNAAANGEADDSEAKDPLRGCRYVAALELSSEPRVRKHLRALYRRRAFLTTKPTKKGLTVIDAFHDYYGLHLIHNKPITDHFPVDSKEIGKRIARLTAQERNEYDAEMKRRERESCVQYLNILKAEQTGDVSVHVHLPLKEENENYWSSGSKDADPVMARTNQQTEILMDELEKVYLPPDGDTDEWNEERRKVLRMALTNFLLPQFETELRRELREVATKHGVEAAAEGLRATAMEGPYRPAALIHTESRFIVPTGDLPIVGVCCATDEKDATYLASVSKSGEASDFLAIPAGSRVDSGKMREKAIMFLLQARPAAVVVGTSGGFSSRMFARKMGDLIMEAEKRWTNRFIQRDDEDDETFEARQQTFRNLMSKNPDYHYDQDEEEEEWKCNVELLDDSVAQLFGRSVRGKKEFPDFPVNHKGAISLARYAKDPLAELTYAWSVASDAGVFGTEMLYLNIHPLQQLLPKTMLLREYERVLCDVTAEVGADINACCSFTHLRSLLIFLPGLGPRKTANLTQAVAQLGGTITKRRDLLEKRLLKPVVYNNVVAFLRIRKNEQLDKQFLHPLDDTRVHPDIYLRHNWAVKIALDALGREDAPSKSNKALEDVMKNSTGEVMRLYKATTGAWEQRYGRGSQFNPQNWDPRYNVPSDEWTDEVDNLDLDAYANRIEQNKFGRWHSHFEMIKWEFRLPFADPRKPMEPLTGDKLFRLITGESDQSLRPGKEVTGKVLNNGDFGSRVKLEGDIPAFIPLRLMSDEHVEAAEEIVTVGQVVTAVVMEVKKEHMTVDMSLKMSDFRRNPSSWERPVTLPPLDPHFDMVAAAKIEQDNNKKREQHLEALQLSLGGGGEDGEGGVSKKLAGRVVRRACTHPAFRNAKNDEVDRELKEAGAAMVGEALIRPSSKQSDSLAVHWVVKEGSIKVIEVLEEDKETDASIGNTLKIKDEVYGSIDELLGRYIAPMNDHVEELTSHRKFIDLPEDDVDEKLKAEKRANPKSIPYALCWMEMHPGYASLRFVSSTTPRNHPISIGPRGFGWASKTFLSLDKLVNDFKKNPRGTQKRAPPKPDSSGPIQPPPPPPKPATSRWGERAAPSAAEATNWQQPPPPPPVQVADSRWGAPIVAPQMATAGGPVGGWQQQQQAMPYRPPPPPRPPTNLLPPPPAYGHQQPILPPPPRPPPPPMHSRPPPPPPPMGRPPPPPPPQQQQQQQPPMIGQQQMHQQQQQQLPVPPPGPPPAFNNLASPASIGRGRGRTLPAWMAKQN